VERVQGIGGIFFKSPDPKALGRWYAENLGVPTQDWGGASFVWSEQDRPHSASTVWSPFSSDTTYFAPSEASFMINFRVRDLEAMLAQVAAAGAKVFDERESSEFGDFAWFLDPDGNKVELWQPPATPPA
jgi:predicted enzyme related to lactoylglutathione lyase